MKLKQSGWRKIAMGAAAAGLGLAALAHATNYTLWVNGRTGGGQLGNYADFTYWGPAGTAAGVNKKAVNWDGYNSISNQNYLVRNALDCYCTGSNWCYIGRHPRRPPGHRAPPRPPRLSRAAAELSQAQP